MEFNKLIPELSVKDIKTSHWFYTDVIGFTTEYSRPQDKFHFISIEGSQLMIEETNNHWWTGELEHPYGRGMNLQIEVSDVSSIIERLEEANVTLFRPLKESWYSGEDVEYGQLEFLVQDPDGYLLRFIQDIGARDR